MNTLYRMMLITGLGFFAQWLRLRDSNNTGRDDMGGRLIEAFTPVAVGIIDNSSGNRLLTALKVSRDAHDALIAELEDAES